MFRDGSVKKVISNNDTNCFAKLSSKHVLDGIYSYLYAHSTNNHWRKKPLWKAVMAYNIVISVINPIRCSWTIRYLIQKHVDNPSSTRHTPRHVGGSTSRVLNGTVMITVNIGLVCKALESQHQRPVFAGKKKNYLPSQQVKVTDHVKCRCRLPGLKVDVKEHPRTQDTLAVTTLAVTTLAEIILAPMYLTPCEWRG